ncbi:hypothetical protein LOK49_LG04G01999 [Camellia lanceoleosa]|uniref:Uncharacterized protein n=1 Tax=Camellia lanceoleosa TaxID=1840588 RepID=A0ACC0I4F4_9ERIC|nr:hypothetical protein LOK49_LG04G01999 [Camellia lanceoleosa]
MVFAGHSSGGAMAMLATAWFLEEYLRPNSSQTTPVWLELAGMWDESIEMLKRYELLDEFEGHKEWIELGTEYIQTISGTSRYCQLL